MSRGHFAKPLSRVTIGDVIEHLAFETPFSPKELVTSPSRTGYLRELRAATVWCALATTHRSLAAIARALGQSGPTAASLRDQAELLRQIDSDFLALTDAVVAALRDAFPPVTAELVAEVRA